MTCENVERLADAYADGELAFEETLALEAHVEQCQACAARLEQIRTLKDALRAAPYFSAPAALAARVRTTVADAAVSSSRPRPRVFRWQPWLVSAASIAIVALAVVGVLRRGGALDDATAAAVVEGHVRSLMADHLTDVTSTDRHTVKPWFAGRVDFAPTVVDLVSEGFPLIGGRLDYIDHHPAAALVYKRGGHPINVFVWPQASGSPTHVTRSDARGYHVISWARGGVAVWVVSDVALTELADFARKLDAATHD